MRDWQDEAFPAEAGAWIESHVEVTGEVERAHVRPWSTVLRVPAKGGDVYFKALPPGACDALVTAKLAELRPGLVIAPLAVDLDRNWMLLPDGGERLRELFEREHHPRPWEKILPAYADLQLASVPVLDGLVANGLLDLRSAQVPELAERLGNELGDAPPAGTERVCAELAAFGIPETVQHDDLHDGNVFAGPAGYRIFDWGDAVASHPFCSLVVGLRGIAFRFELGEHDPDVERLRDAYLTGFSAYGTPDELRRAAELAAPIGMLSRAWSWSRVAAVAAEPDEHAQAAGEWYQDFAAAVESA